MPWFFFPDSHPYAPIEVVEQICEKQSALAKILQDVPSRLVPTTLSTVDRCGRFDNPWTAVLLKLASGRSFQLARGIHKHSMFNIRHIDSLCIRTFETSYILLFVPKAVALNSLIDCQCPESIASAWAFKPATPSHTDCLDRQWTQASNDCSPRRRTASVPYTCSKEGMPSNRMPIG